MRKKPWKSQIRKVCIWLLVIAICIQGFGFTSVSAMESEPVPFTEESCDLEEMSTEPATESSVNMETEEILTEADTEPDTENPDELAVPDPMTVEFLEKVMGLNSAKQLSGQVLRRAPARAVQKCDRIEIVDVNGAPIAGASSSIPMGWISDIAEWDFPDGGHYELQSAKVGNHDCVFVGEYNGQVYYSEDGSIAMKLEDGEKIRLVYRRYYLVTFVENNADWGVVSNAAGEMPDNAPVKVYADESPMEFTVAAGNVVGEVRYKVSSIEPSAAVTRTSGDEYSGTYSANLTGDTTIQVNYDNTGVYRVTVNSSSIGADGTEIDGLYSISPDSFAADDQCYSSFTVTLKTKKDVRLTSLNLNGRVFFSSGGEFPTDDGDSQTVTGWDGTIYSVQIQVQKGSGDIGHTYIISVTPQRQYNKYLPVDLNFDVTYEKANEAVNVLHVYTDGQRSDEGADVAYWRPVETGYLTGTKYTGEGALEKTSDGTTYSLDPTYGSSISGYRRVVLIFAKAKPGYGISVDYSNGGTSNSQCMANAGTIDKLLSLNSGEWEGCKNFQAIVQNAYNAAKAAGYTHFIAMVGPGNHLHNSDIAYSHVRAHKDQFYVEYNKGSLPAGVEPKYIPQHEGNYSYGPYDWGDSFVVGEGLPQPECEGYEFAGWKVAGTELIYQQNAVLQLEGEQLANAKTKVQYRTHPASVDGIKLIAQWTKKPDAQEREVTIKHYLKKADGTEELKLTETQTVLFYEDETEKTITAIPKTTFEGYVFDTEDQRNVVEATVRKDETEQVELLLYYKPIDANKVRIAYRQSEEGKFLWNSFENGDPKEYSYGDTHTILTEDIINPDSSAYGWNISGWRMKNDSSEKMYRVGESFPIDNIALNCAIRYGDSGETYYQIELVPVWDIPADTKVYIAYTNDVKGKTERESDFIKVEGANELLYNLGPYSLGTDVIISNMPGQTDGFIGWRLKGDPDGTIYKPGATFTPAKENLPFAFDYTQDDWEIGTGIIILPYKQYEFIPVWVGTLDLTKKTIGAPTADANRTFTFTLTATPPEDQSGESLVGKTFPVEWTSGNGVQSITFDADGKATISLGANSSAKIKDLPAGWTVAISEQKYFNYTAEYFKDDDSETITAPNNVVIRKGATCSVTCTNTYTPPTGIALSKGTWLGVLLIVSLMGCLLMLTRRRRAQ